MKEGQVEMKKLLASIVLTTLFLLTACSNTVETVCIIHGLTITIQSENGEISSIVREGVIDISNMSEDEIELAIEVGLEAAIALAGASAEITYNIDGDTLTISSIFTTEVLTAIADADDGLSLEDFLTMIEADGGNCN